MCNCVPGALGQAGFSVTHTTKKICAVEGSSVVLPCSYKYPSRYTFGTGNWYTTWGFHREPKDLSLEPTYAGRVEYSTVQYSTDCSLRVKDLRVTDSGIYYFRFKARMPQGSLTYRWISDSSGISLSITGNFVQVYVSMF